jgi:hypothetical protein
MTNLFAEPAWVFLLKQGKYPCETKEEPNDIENKKDTVCRLESKKDFSRHTFTLHGSEAGVIKEDKAGVIRENESEHKRNAAIRKWILAKDEGNDPVRRKPENV